MKDKYHDYLVHLPNCRHFHTRLLITEYGTRSTYHISKGKQVSNSWQHLRGCAQKFSLSGGSWCHVVTFSKVAQTLTQNQDLCWRLRPNAVSTKDFTQTRQTLGTSYASLIQSSVRPGPFPRWLLRDFSGKHRSRSLFIRIWRMDFQCKCMICMTWTVISVERFA